MPHSPGPWTINSNGDGTHYLTAGKGLDVADTRSCTDEPANARLIAAAPDLYAACKALLALHADDGTRDDVTEWKAARAALAKAAPANGGAK